MKFQATITYYGSDGGALLETEQGPLNFLAAAMDAAKYEACRVVGDLIGVTEIRVTMRVLP